MNLYLIKVKYRDRFGTLPVVADFMSLALLQAIKLLPGDAEILGAVLA